MSTVTDPGFFLVGGGAPAPKWVCYPVFCRKLHENEKIWTPGRVPGATPLDPPMVHFCLHFQCTNDELPSTFIHEERVQVDENVHLFPLWRNASNRVEV